jgi:predicted flap endonuclease-1-like 5' DNA nuclease
MTKRLDLNDDEKCSFPYSAFIPVIAALAALLLLILRSRRKGPAVEMKDQRREQVKSILLPAEAPPVSPPTADDLTRIEGIGPKVATTLAAAGITTFKQLAKLNPEVIREILRKAGNRISNPATWPEQARLAAGGKWEELEKYQAELKGGRAV